MHAAKTIAVLFLLSVLACAVPPSSGLLANVSGRATTSLNGPWHMIVDPYETGLGERYYENAKPKIRVTGSNMTSIGPIRSTFPGTGTRKKKASSSTRARSGMRDRSSITGRGALARSLYFGAANYFTRVYLNGKEAGGT